MFDISKAIIHRMQLAKEDFYATAQRIGHHQFLEFAGFMHEYTLMLENNAAKSHNGTYVAEKLDCIFGDWAREHAEFAQGFFGALAHKGWPCRYAKRIT
jgi:hypothetical protein